MLCGVRRAGRGRRRSGRRCRRRCAAGRGSWVRSWVFSVVVAGGGDAAQVAVLEPVAVSFEADDLRVVDEAVDHRGGDYVVAEDLAPAPERLVAGHDETGPLI